MSAAGVPRSPSHESVATDLSLFSVSSAASDAKLLRLLACKAGQGPDPSLRASPNPDKSQFRAGLRADACREVLAGCGALCAALGLRRSFSAGDVTPGALPERMRSATSDVCLAAALRGGGLGAAVSSWSAGAAAGGSRPPSPPRARPPRRDHIRQSYIKKRLLSTYKALERLSQSEFNLDKLEAAAGAAAGAPALSVPPPGRTPYTRFVHPEEAHLALTTADLERERGRPLSKYERNMMIFNWLHTLDEAEPTAE